MCVILVLECCWENKSKTFVNKTKKICTFFSLPVFVIQPLAVFCHSTDSVFPGISSWSSHSKTFLLVAKINFCKSLFAFFFIYLPKGKTHLQLPWDNNLSVNYQLLSGSSLSTLSLSLSLLSLSLSLCPFRSCLYSSRGVKIQRGIFQKDS